MQMRSFLDLAYSMSISASEPEDTEMWEGTMTMEIDPEALDKRRAV